MRKRCRSVIGAIRFSPQQPIVRDLLPFKRWAQPFVNQRGDPGESKPDDYQLNPVAMLYKKSKALAIVDPKKFFVDALCSYKEVTSFDLVKLDLGAEIFVGASALFSFTGISFRLSRRVLDTAKARVSKDNAKLQIWYEWLETLHNYFKGNWKAIKKHNNDLVFSYWIIYTYRKCCCKRPIIIVS